jgi:hypothetical protein
MRSYRLYIPTPFLLLFVAILAGLPIVALVLTGAAVLGRLEGPPWEFLLLCTVIMVFIAYMFLRIPFEIRIRDDGMLEFRSLFGRTSLSPSEVISVKARGSQLGFADLRSSTRTIPLITQMDGFHEFLSTLKSLNPSVELRGC